MLKVMQTLMMKQRMKARMSMKKLVFEKEKVFSCPFQKEMIQEMK